MRNQLFSKIPCEWVRYESRCETVIWLFSNCSRFLYSTYPSGRLLVTVFVHKKFHVIVIVEAYDILLSHSCTYCNWLTLYVHCTIIQSTYARRDMAYRINKIAKYSHQPTHETISACKWLLDYLNSTKKIRLEFH